MIVYPKIEGSAGLQVTVSDDKVTDLRFLIQDYRRFYTHAVKGKPVIAVPSFLSRICGTCSVAHLFASIKAIEASQGIEVTTQTKILRRLSIQRSYDKRSCTAFIFLYTS